MSRAAARADAERGFSIVVLVASITVMLILMGAAVPTWRYIMKNDREEELFFRGDQIARGVERYQRKNGNALPVSLELLVKGHYLRKLYKDPMSKDGKWRIIHPGEAMIPAPGGAVPRPGMTPQPGATPSPGSPGLGGFGNVPPGMGGPVQGAILGVASTNTDKSLKLMNGRSRYDQWLFLAGQPRLLGADQGVRLSPGGIGGVPGAPRGNPTSFPPGAIPTPRPLKPAY
jgi:type II secretory pathway pseudopilin PulG